MVLDVKRGRPPSRDGLLPRSRLIARLQQDPEVPLLAVSAPAGYGKTALLWEWLSEDPRDCAWVALEERHNDPKQLLEEILQALEDAQDDFAASEIREALNAPHADLSGVALARLLSALAFCARPAVIVLDDAHTLNAPAALRSVGVLAEHLPPGFQLALASRTALSLHMGRLRAHRAVLEFHTQDLAMTLAEAGELLEMAGLRLTSVQLEALMERTEGWPAGLRLAALSLREEPDAGAALARFTGADRVLAEYMREEFLDQLAPEALDFLIRTAILAELDGALCDAVLQCSGSGRTLEHLARKANLPLIELDRDSRRYRCHRLLRDTLLSELRHGGGTAEAELHQRASTWYAAQGELDSAIDHAVLARDHPRAGELLWENLPRYIARGRNPAVQRWLDTFDSSELAHSPSLALVAAHSHLAAGEIRLAEHWGLTAAGALARASAVQTTSHAPLASLPAGVALIEAAVARLGVAAMGGDAARAYALELPASPWRSLCCLLLGVAEHLRGNHPQARAQLEEGIHRSAIEAPGVEAACLAQLATLLLEEDDLQAAVALIDRALIQTEVHGLDAYPTSAFTFAAAAAAHARAGRVQEAQRHLRRATRLLAVLDDFTPWYEAQTRIVLARASLALADVRQARTLLAEASQRARRVPDATLLRVWLEEIWEQVDTAAAFALTGSAALTMAELRILRFLPTHLSFREIGQRLHVSTNTVKTQAHAVYRKLDATSRSQAVARAEEIGLLDA